MYTSLESPGQNDRVETYKTLYLPNETGVNNNRKPDFAIKMSEWNVMNTVAPVTRTTFPIR